MKDMTGKKFNKWEVIKFVGKNAHGVPTWLCKCECGTVKSQQGGQLRSGATKSCGCGKKTNFVHGMWQSRFYSIWGSMRDRCYRKKHVAYSRYGGRGITIEWKSFIDFRDDMLESYNEHVRLYGEKQTTIDRINNDGNYSRDNCRWATYSENIRNRRRKTN